MNKGKLYPLPDKYKDSIVFGLKIKSFVSPEKDKYLSVASLKELKKFLPQIDTDKHYDLLPFSCNAFVANRLNLNDDGVMTEEALAIADLFPLKFLDVDHDRSKIIGVITSTAFTEFGTDKPLTRDDVKNVKNPFNVLCAGVIWRSANPKLADFIEETNDPESEHYLEISASWELGFSEVYLILLEGDNKNFEDGRIITDPDEIKQLEGKLRAYGGLGKVDGKRIGRIPVRDILPLGLGAVESPAAEVSGIAVKIENKDNSDKTQSNSAQNTLSSIFIKQLKDAPESGAGYHKCDIEMNDGSIAKDIIISNCSDMPEDMDASKVKKITIKATQNEQSLLKNENLLDSKNDDSSKECMDEKLTQISKCLQNINNHLNLSDKDLECVAEFILDKNGKRDLVNTLTEIAANKKEIISQNNKTNVKELNTMNINKVEDITTESLKEITASQIQDFIQKKCAEVSENWVAEKKTKEEQVKSLAEAKKTLDETVISLNTKLAEVNKSLETIKAEAAEKAKIEVYNQRMAHIESIYELDPEITKIVASDLKDVDDEGFKKIEEKYKVLFKDKNREEIEAAKKKVAKTSKTEDPEDKKDKGADEDTEDKNGKKLPPWLQKKKDSKASTVVEDAVQNSEKEKVNIPNSSSTETPTLLERAKKAFGKENVKIDCSRRRII